MYSILISENESLYSGGLWHSKLIKNDCVYISAVNKGVSEAVVTMPLTENFAEILYSKGDGDAVIAQGNINLYIPPSASIALKFSADKREGLYKGNVRQSRISPGDFVFESDSSGFVGLYQEINGVMKLLKIFGFGDVITVDGDPCVLKAFFWDGMIPERKVFVLVS